MPFRRSGARPLAPAWHVTLTLGLLAPSSPAAHAADLTLREAGSTLLYPLFQRWVPDYTAANPGAAITIDATGSGDGIAEAITGHAQIGASDAYMSDEQAEHNREIVNMPLAIAAQTVNYNLPGLNGAASKLDGPTLAGIYDGTIQQLGRAADRRAEPGRQAAARDHRADPPRRCFGRYLRVYPVPRFLDADGGRTGSATAPRSPGRRSPAKRPRPAMRAWCKTVAATPYSIAYIGISFHDDIAKAGLGTAMIKSQAGSSCCRRRKR